MARILVIEDNRANLELIVYLLEAYDHATWTALDGVSGLEAALVAHPDLTLCGIQLSGMDGYAVVRRLKSDPALRAIPVLAVTAYARAGDCDQILAAGFETTLPSRSCRKR
jgi:CheY-like chemotaxis protein